MSMAEPMFTVIDDGTPIDVAPRDGAERVRRAQESGRPGALDEAERAAYLGVSAEERGRRLASLEAPEFTLPDLDGRSHSLRDHRGVKIFLVAYGSW
jgi:hypothetical protein